MSFDSYYATYKKKNQTTTSASKKGGGSSFDNYHENYQKERTSSNDEVDTEGGSSFDNYYAKYQDKKNTWAKLDEQTNNPMFAQEMDESWQDVSKKETPKVQATITKKQPAYENPNEITPFNASSRQVEANKKELETAKKNTDNNRYTMGDNLTQTLSTNAAADLVTGGSRTKNFVKDAASKVGNTAKSIGNGVKDFGVGVAQGFSSGAMKFGKMAYDNLTPRASKNMLIDTMEGPNGEEIKGQAMVDVLNEMTKGRKDSLTYSLDEKGKIVATDNLDRLIDKGIEKTSIKEDSTTANKVGGMVGDVINQVGQMATIGNITGKIAPASNHIANSMIQGGLTGASNSAVNSEINNEDLETTMKNALRGGVFFAAGSGASELAGAGITSALTNRGLQNSIPAYVGEEVLKGGAFSLAGELASLPTYPLLGDEMPSVQEIGVDMATGVLYDLVGGITKIPSLKQNSQAILKQAQQNINQSGKIISQLEARGNGDVKTMNTLYDSLQTEIAKTQYELNNARLLGQEATVQAYASTLSNISNDLKKKQGMLNAAATTKIGANTNAPKNASSVPTSLGGQASARLNNNTNGVPVGRAYTNIDNGVIQQGGNTSKLLPLRPQVATEQQNVAEPNKSTPKIEKALESEIKQNTAIPKVERKSFTVDRVNRVSKQNEKLTFTEGEEVKSYTGVNALENGNYEVEKVTGVYTPPNEGKSFIINQNGVYIDTQLIEKISTPQAQEVEKVEEVAKVEEIVNDPAPAPAKNTHSQKLSTMADKLQSSIDNYRKERLSNTPKRQRETASALKEADRIEEKQSTLRKIATKSEAGELKHLANLSSLAQYDTLDRAGNRAYYKTKNLSEVGNRNPISRLDAIENAEMPLDNLYKEHLVRFTQEAKNKNVPGTVKAATQLLKYLNSTKGDYVSLGDKQVEQIETILKSPGSKDLIRSEAVKDDVAEQKRLQKMGITSTKVLKETLRELETIKAESIVAKTPEQLRAEKVKVLETEATNSKINGYFPTPKKLVKNMLDIADIKEGEKVLEPSAGSGDIADMVGVGKIDVVEYSNLLNTILKEKGHNVVGNNALEVTKTYDKIIMNPPFEKNQDIDHVTYAFENNLNNGGRIVAITSSHFTFASDKKSQAFRKLVEANGYFEKLPEGSFKDSKKSTGVNTVLVVLEKEGTADNSVYLKKDDGTYEKGEITYRDDFDSYVEVTKEDGTVTEVTPNKVITAEVYQKETIKSKGENLLTVQKEAINSKKVMAAKSSEVVEFLKGQKEGKKPMKIYLSPELAGVDNIKAIGQYLKFTDNPKDYKLDTFQSDLSNTHPEVKELGMEEFGTWLVDQVTTFRENKSLIEKAELSYKESFNLLNVKSKDMQSVAQLKEAVAGIEENMRRFPLSLQFFAEQQIKQYKTLLKQLESEGVSKETLDRVAMLQREFKASQVALEKEVIKNEERINSLIEKQKREKNTAVVKSEVKAALEKEAIQERAEAKLNRVTEKLNREKKLAVAKSELKAGYEKLAAKNTKKAKDEMARFKRMSSKNNQEVKGKLKKLNKIARETKFKMEPATKEAVLDIVKALEGRSISGKSQEAIISLDKALEKMKEYGDTPGLSENMRERISTIKTIDTDLTYEEFMDIYNSVNVLVHQNKMQNKFTTSERKETIDEAVKEVEAKGTNKLKNKLGRGVKVLKQNSNLTVKREHLDDKIYLPQLMPKNLMAHIEGTEGGALRRIMYKGMVKGHTIKYRYKKKSMDFFAENLKDVDMKAIDTGSYKVTVNGGEEMAITSLEKLAISLNSYNEKNRYSLTESGFARFNATDVYTINDASLDKLVKDLTPDEAKAKDVIFEYFDTLNQEEINRFTMLMWNYEGANEPFYFPKITVESERAISEAGTVEENGIGKIQPKNLENADFLKPKKKTKTPIQLKNPFEVVMQMMEETANMVAYAPVIRDSKRLLKKVKPFITKNYSDVMYRQMNDYVNAMTQPSGMRVESDTILNKFYNNTVTAIFGLNVSTAAKQPLGLFNVATEIEAKYLLKALTVSPKTIKAKKPIIEEYAPVLWDRSQGHIDREMSETNLKKSVNKTFYGKKTARDYTTAHITKMDMLVAYRIWEAAENKVKATTNLKPGSTEYYTEIGDMATEITLTTQSSGEFTHRSQLMRSDNLWKKSMTAFRGQAQIALNQLDMAYERFKETKNIGQFTRAALFVWMIPGVLSVGVGELVKYMQGNDKSLIVKKKQAEESGLEENEEEVTEEFAKRILGELVSTNVYTGLAYDTIDSATNFYGANSGNPLFSELQNLAKGVAYLKQRKPDEAFETMSESLLKLTSIPVDNIQKLAETGVAIAKGYDYSLTDQENFEQYNTEVNQFEAKVKKTKMIPTDEQTATVNTINSYNRSINRITATLEDDEIDLTGEEIEQLEADREILLKEANAYFRANMHYIQ